MKKQTRQYDVVIVGASMAGNAAAMMYAARGLQVALIERSSDIESYKKICTHFLQPDATPILQQLGLAEAMEAAGAVRNSGRAWTRYGWIGSGYDPESYGYNVRREVLDPLMRRRAADTPGVDLILGTAFKDLVYENGRIAGILARQRNGTVLEIRAGLVVGADGRYSRTARQAALEETVHPNHRFTYFAYYRNVSLSLQPGSQVWYLEPDVAYALPADGGMTLMVLMLHKDKQEAFKEDVSGNFDRFWANLPDGPDMSRAERASELRGMLSMPNVSREPVVPGLALIGDAAMSPDPLWGNGISWALQSATWLTAETAVALQEGTAAAVDNGLQRYRAQHRAQLAGRFARDADFAQARRFNMVERLMYAATVQDPAFGRYTGPHSLKVANLRHLPPLSAMVRALWTTLKGRLGGMGPRPQPTSLEPAEVTVS